ncbi:MAG: YcgL domain-containing protein [Xanthomonadaceae bacterium]|nr:YcgL domain-containing protein [Xanthomonadaceae bacterium]
MRAYVYKSQKKIDTYIYLAVRDDFSRLPEMLRMELEPLTFVLETELTPERRLAQADPDAVRESLDVRGFFIQFPPRREESDYRDA